MERYIILQVTHLGNPVPNMRPRFGNGRTYNDPKYTQYKREMVKSILLANKEWNVPMAPTEKKERTKELKTVRYGLSLQVYKTKDIGDLDNYLKTCNDALEDSGLIANDKQIIRLYGPFFMEIDMKNPRVEFQLVKL